MQVRHVPTARDPAYQWHLLLRVGFIVAPILAGLDKFFDFTVDWSRYVAPWVNGHSARYRR